MTPMESKPVERLLAVGRGKSTHLGMVSLEYLDWSALVTLSSLPVEAPIEHVDFMALPKPERNKLKKAAFVSFGVFEDGHRNKDSVSSRSAAQLDYDKQTLKLFQRLEEEELTGGVLPFSYVGHTTRSHTDEAPRLRLMVPFSRDVTPEEYPRCVMAIHKLLDAPELDEGSLQPERLMYLPVVNRNAPFWCWQSRGTGYVDPDYLLSVGAPEEPEEEPNDLDVALSETPLTFHQKVNALAMKAFATWVPELFPEAQPYKDGYRIPSASLGRELEEDISIVSKGIKDFGVADIGDARHGKRSPVALVAEWKETATTDEAANWLCKRLGVEPSAMGAPVAHKPRADGSDNPFEVHEWSDYKQNYLSTPWIVKGVLPQAEVGILYGQSGSGKTFFVLDMAACIARGAEWRGRKVSDCRVVYVAAEAREGIKKRMDAYDQHICADGVRPAIIASAPNLLSTDTTKLAEAIGSAGLIILDTMAASHSGDENSAKDMGLFLAACKDLSQATGAMVLAVHHTGKEDSKGMRGSSALFAGADFVMEVFKNDNEHGAMLSKSRDDVTGTSFSFVLKRVVVGHDEDGDEVTTCVVEPIQKEVSKVTKKPKKLANTNDTRYDFSREMLALIEDLAYKSNTGKVHKDEIFEQLLHKYPGKLKRNLAAVLLRLEQLGAIRQTLDWYSVEEDEEALG